MFNRYNKKTTTTSNRLTIVHASDIENERGKIERKMGREKNEEQKKKENRAECDSNELTIYKEEKKKIDDRSYVCRFVALYFFSNVLKEKKTKKKKKK